MTEDELRAIPQLKDIPIYNESDDVGCESLLRCYDTAYTGETPEADDMDYLSQMLSDPQYVAQGMIRYSLADVRPVFWKKRYS